MTIDQYWNNPIVAVLCVTVVASVVSAIILWLSHRDTQRLCAQMDADHQAVLKRMDERRRQP